MFTILAMSYTLAMTDDYRPEMKPDGVQEAPLTKARAWLTRLIDDALTGRPAAFTVRGRRRAYLVSPEFYEKAVKAMDN